MQTKAHVVAFPSGTTTANGALHLSLKDNKSELMKPLGYSVLSLTKAFSSNTSNSQYHSNYSYYTSFLGLVENFIKNDFPHHAPLQAWVNHTSMVTPTLQHNITSLDNLQNQAIPSITRQLDSTPLKPLRLESGVQSYYTQSNRMIVRAMEKYFRTAADHPKWVALQKKFSQRIATHSSFRHKATEPSSILPKELNHCQDVNFISSLPWVASSFCINQVWSIHPGISGLNDPSALKVLSYLQFLKTAKFVRIVLNHF